MKKWILVFILAFGFNLIWEELHKFLYIHYQGKEISQLVLIKAAFVDGVIILGLILLIHLINLSKKPWLIVIFGIIISVLIEKWALVTGRWEYNNLMPIIPVLKVGLTPIIQLGLLGYLIHRLIFKEKA